MKYVFQFGRILLFCLMGELLHMILPLPIPASIYGLILLLAALLTGIVCPWCQTLTQFKNIQTKAPLMERLGELFPELY